MFVSLRQHIHIQEYFFFTNVSILMEFLSTVQRIAKPLHRAGVVLVGAMSIRHLAVRLLESRQHFPVQLIGGVGKMSRHIAGVRVFFL